MLEEVWRGHLMEPGAQALGIAYAKAGRREDAERIAAMLPRLASKAQVFAALGDKRPHVRNTRPNGADGAGSCRKGFSLSPEFCVPARRSAAGGAAEEGRLAGLRFMRWFGVLALHAAFCRRIKLLAANLDVHLIASSSF